MESKQKRTWEGIMLIRTFVLNVLNNESKILTSHDITDRNAEQIEPVITQVCKIADSSELKAAKVLICLFI